MKQFTLFIASFILLVLSTTTHAQSLRYDDDASQQIIKSFRSAFSVNVKDCEGVFLIAPPDPTNPGFKKDLPMGIDLKPLLESYITKGTKKFLLSGVGDAIGCDAYCASQALTDWRLRGQLFGFDIAFGKLDSIIAEQPGKYYVVAYTEEGCAVVETFVVAGCVGKSAGGNIVDTIVIELRLGGTTGTGNLRESLDVQVYPNPITNQMLRVIIPTEVKEDLIFMIYDLQGRKILETEASDIDCSKFAPSTYTLQVLSNKTGVRVGAVQFVKPQ